MTDRERELASLGIEHAAKPKPKNIRVTIDRDGVWAGTGRWTEDCEIVDCAAVLGPDQDASDETYELLCDALSGLPQLEDRWRGPVSVDRPDGLYTATLIG